MSDPAIRKATRTILRLDLKPEEESPQEQEDRGSCSSYQAGLVSGQARERLLPPLLISHSGADQVQGPRLLAALQKAARRKDSALSIPNSSRNCYQDHLNGQQVQVWMQRQGHG